MTPAKPLSKRDRPLLDEQGAGPVDVLKQFMAEMNRWERRAWEEHNQTVAAGGDLPAKHLRDLAAMNAIFAKFCTPKGRAHNHAGVFGRPPAYDPDAEAVLQVIAESTKRVVIYTQQRTGGHFNYRYVLLRRGNQWRIDNRQRLGLNEKWVRDIL